MALPLAVRIAFSPFGPLAVISIVVRRTRASTICDAMVRFLRVLDAGLVAARRGVVLAPEHLANHASRFVQRLIRERRGIGPVIRDQAFHLTAAGLDALKQPLRDLHRPLGRESELAARFLG